MRRSSVAILALTRGFCELNLGAFCSVVKSKDMDPLIVNPLPLVKSPNMAPNFLSFFQMPFKDDVFKTIMPSLERVGKDECRVSYNSIYSLMIPKDTLNSLKIHNLSIHSFHQL